MRNYVHPGRHAQDRPWSETCERDYKDAKAIYVILLSKIIGTDRKKSKLLIEKDAQRAVQARPSL